MDASHRIAMKIPALPAVLKLAAGIFAYFIAALPIQAAEAEPLHFGIGLLHGVRAESNRDADPQQMFRPLAQYLKAKLKRPVLLRSLNSKESLVRGLMRNEIDFVLVGSWAYVLANHEVQAQAIATIAYQGKSDSFAIIVANPKSRIKDVEDLKGKSFAFADRTSASGFLIPFHLFQMRGIDPQRDFRKLVYSDHDSVEQQVTSGAVDAGADFSSNRSAMIESRKIRSKDSKVIWASERIPNEALAVSAKIFADKQLTAQLQKALLGTGLAGIRNSSLLPPQCSGFVQSDNARYRSVRDAGLATGRIRLPSMSMLREDEEQEPSKKEAQGRLKLSKS